MLLKFCYPSYTLGQPNLILIDRKALIFQIYNDKNDGFILSMGSINDGQNILDMFNKGYEAADHNYNDAGVGLIFDGRSHPMLEDNPGNGISGTEGVLNPSSSADEGYLASKTYL